MLKKNILSWGRAWPETSRKVLSLLISWLFPFFTVQYMCVYKMVVYMECFTNRTHPISDLMFLTFPVKKAILEILFFIQSDDVWDSFLAMHHTRYLFLVCKRLCTYIIHFFYKNIETQGNPAFLCADLEVWQWALSWSF